MSPRFSALRLLVSVFFIAVCVVFVTMFIVDAAR